MKLIDVITIDKLIITEHIINVNDRDEKLNYVDEVWRLIELSYAKIGGSNFRDKDDLIDDTNLWKLKKLNGKIIAGRIYKDKSGLNKSIAAFTNKTVSGIKSLYDIISTDIKRGRSYGEVSGKMEELSILKFNAVPVESKYVSKILNKEIIPDEDGYHYTRMIGGKPHTKILVTGDVTMFNKIGVEIK